VCVCVCRHSHLLDYLVRCALQMVSPGGMTEFIVEQANDHWNRELCKRGGFSGHLENLTREILSIDVEGTDIQEILKGMYCHV
jgi:hypothetical protein